jgi:hypothetical protein
VGTSSVLGATSLPVAAGASLSHLTDSVVLGLLDYFAFWIKNTLDAKLAVLTPTSSDAVPTANRFPYSPGEYWVRSSVPALYVWWNGPSRRVADTLVYDRRDREIHVQYIFEELIAPDGVTARAGLMSAVDAALFKACARGRHPSYGYNSSPAGTPLVASLAPESHLAFEYLGGTEGMMSPVPYSNPRPGGEGGGHVIRFYPSLLARVAVMERVGADLPDDPDDVFRDADVTISTNETGDPTDVYEILERYLPGFDGDP